MNAETRPPAAAPAGAPAPLAKPARAYALGVLVIIYVFNFLDRQIVNILAEPIKADLGLADWQIGVMAGFAFAIFYTVLGIPIARYAERADRVKIISAAVAVWSAFTILCGLAGNFVQLLAARIGVGVGEAGCTPPAHSLICDYTPKEERASALALYSMGIPLGSLAGMVVGGLIADAYGWRVAFFVAGAPGDCLGADRLADPARAPPQGHAQHVRSASGQLARPARRHARAALEGVLLVDFRRRGAGGHDRLRPHNVLRLVLFQKSRRGADGDGWPGQ